MELRPGYLAARRILGQTGCESDAAAGEVKCKKDPRPSVKSWADEEEEGKKMRWYSTL